jgi:hypothetical protein
LLAVLLAGLAAVCPGCGSGSDSGSGPAGGSGSGFTAVVDGKAWEATPISISAQANAGTPGTVILVGTQTDGTKSLGLTLTFYNVRGPGKYALGVDSSIVGGIGQVGEGTGMAGQAVSWITAGTGVDGMAEITSLGAGRIVGTFNYTAAPGKNNALGTNRVVTDGKFDLALKGTLTTLPENAGSKVTAEFGGVLYNAATVDSSLMDFTGGAGFRLSSLSSVHGLSLMLEGVTAAGTFTYSNTSPVRTITAGRNGGTADNCCWGGNAPGDVVEIIVTSLMGSRVKGTFSGTLKPQPGKPATQDLVVTNGTFDVGIR